MVRETRGGTPRLEDVAREAGVSPATASRVLNGSDRRVAEAFRLKVLAAAARIGYTTNLAAQATARGHYPAIGLVVGDIRDQFFARVAFGAIREASDQGFQVNILSTDGDPERERALVAELRRQRPQSLVLVRKRDMTSANSVLLEELRRYERDGGSVVVVGESTGPIPAVSPPDFDGGKFLAKALVNLGYTRFAALTRRRPLASSRDRIDGFRAGLSAAGFALPDELVFPTEQSIAGGVDGVAALLAREDELPELLFAIEDVMATGAILGLERAGYSVPESIAVAGYGCREVQGDEPIRVLTTVRSPLEEMGAAGVRMCLQPWASNGLPLEPEVMIGGTTPRRVAGEPGLLA